MLLSLKNCLVYLDDRAGLVQVLREEQHPQGGQCNAYGVVRLPVQHKAGCHGCMLAVPGSTHQHRVRSVAILLPGPTAGNGPLMAAAHANHDNYEFGVREFGTQRKTLCTHAYCRKIGAEMVEAS